MEPKLRDSDSQPAENTDQMSQTDSSIRVLSRELGSDFRNLLNQHVALVKSESQSSLVKVQAGLFLAGLAVFLAAFGLIRLLESLVVFGGQAWGWSAGLQTTLAGLLLLTVAVILGLVARGRIKEASRNSNSIMDEMKEDLQWLRKLL